MHGQQNITIWLYIVTNAFVSEVETMFACNLAGCPLKIKVGITAVI